MSTRYTRTARLFAIVSVAALVLSGIVVQQVVTQALREAGVDDEAATSVRRAVLLALSALGVILLGVVVVAGRAFGGALRQLREAVLARARGNATARMPEFAVGELAELSSAIERLAAHVTARETRSAREASEVSVLLDTISEGILQLDRGGGIVRANPAAQTLLGLQSATAGQPVTSLIRHAGLRRLLERAVSGEAIPAAEIAVEDQRLIVSARPLDAGTVVAFMDLTQVRRLESVRRDFVANVSHELKTPLTSIRGYIETLLTEDTLPVDMQRQFLEVVHKNAERLHHIVDDLLDLSRLESGGWRPELLEVNALDVIQDVWSGCSERAERRSIRFVPPSEPLTVVADPGGLRQILSNLLDNAIRYTPDGGRIDVVAHAPPENGNGRNHDRETVDFVTIEVRDSGAGIPSDALPRIFERFYRVDPARSRAEGGTGLGLSIVKHLVESMGGDVRAESELGKGTIIRFRLPAARWQKHPPELPQSSDS